MLTIYRRHLRACTHRADGRSYRRCHCPIWADGRLGGVEIRRSLGLRDWHKAQDKVREWEAEGQQTEERQPFTLAEADEKFLADARARKLTEATVYKYTLTLRQLEEYAGRCGLRFLTELDIDLLTSFRTGWKDGPVSSAKKLERLRTFFRFAERRKWIDNNPASGLKPPKVFLRPTMPFTHDEMIRILAATEEYAGNAAHNARLNAARIRTLILLLRYSGMRIGDAVGLSADRIAGNRLFLYTAKTGTPVYCVLPQFVVGAITSTPTMTERYLFWNGAGKLQTAVKMRLHRLFALAKIREGHAHRFRDTFAVELLLAGVPMERVSVLLGHQSIRITERHYAPWVRSRQEQLEADLERAWSRDPLALLETKGTRKVHGESERPN